MNVASTKTMRKFVVATRTCWAHLSSAHDCCLVLLFILSTLLHTNGIVVCCLSSDVIRDFVFEDNLKDKDMEPEDKDLQKQQGRRQGQGLKSQGRGQGLETEDKAKDEDLEPRPRPKNLKLKLRTSIYHYYSNKLSSTVVTLI